MNKGRTLLLVAPMISAMVTAALVLLPIAASPRPTFAQSTSAPTSDAPTFKVGDRWTWTNGRTTQIRAIEGVNHVTSGKDGQRRYYDPNWTLVKVVDRQGNAVSESGIGRKLLEFPMSIGSEWSWHGSLLSVGNQFRDYKDAFRVGAYDEVKTKAGLFKAFVISHVQDGQGRMGGTTTNRRTLWYSPEAKVIVKVEHNTRGWTPLQDYELESYSLK